jgi:hypothetical protein
MTMMSFFTDSGEPCMKRLTIIIPILALLIAGCAGGSSPDGMDGAGFEPAGNEFPIPGFGDGEILDPEGEPDPDDGNITGGGTKTTEDGDDVEISKPTVEVAVIGHPYELKLEARGGSGNYTWSTGKLPAGLELIEDTISGTPTEIDRRRIIIRAIDSDDSENSDSLRIYINIIEGEPSETDKEIKFNMFDDSGKQQKIVDNYAYEREYEIDIGRAYRLSAGIKSKTKYEWSIQSSWTRNFPSFCDESFGQDGKCRGESKLDKITGSDIFILMAEPNAIALDVKNSFGKTGRTLVVSEGPVWDEPETKIHAVKPKPILFYIVEYLTGNHKYSGTTGVVSFEINGFKAVNIVGTRLKGSGFGVKVVRDHFAKAKWGSFTIVERNPSTNSDGLSEFSEMEITIQSDDTWHMAGIRITAIYEDTSGYKGNESKVVYYNPCIHQDLDARLVGTLKRPRVEKDTITLRPTDIGICVVTETMPKSFSKNSSTKSLITLELPEIKDLPKRLERDIENLPDYSLDLYNYADNLNLDLNWRKSKDHTNAKRITHGTYLPGAMIGDKDDSQEVNTEIFDKLDGSGYTVKTAGHDAWFPKWIQIAVFTPSPPPGEEERLCSGLFHEFDGEVLLSTGDNNIDGATANVDLTLEKNSGPCNEHFTSDDLDPDSMFYIYNGRYGNEF